MTNREKFKEVFGKDIKWSEAIEPQMLALKSAQINEIDCMEEWLNAEYKDSTTKNNLGVLDKVRAEIKKWYWQADKQALAKDPCVVDAMIDLFIRTIDKYKAGTEPQESEDV